MAQKKSQQTEGLAAFLRYDASDPTTYELFEPGADWESASLYPPIKAAAEFQREDYLRLAWELLRRMPRYRRQYRKLQHHGLRRPTFFLGESFSFFSDERPPAFNGWQAVPLAPHQCTPLRKPRETTLGAYVSARQKDGRSWLVVHRHRWCLDYWGVSRMPDFRKPAKEIDLAALFTAPVRRFDPAPEKDRRVGPRIARGLAGPADLLVRLRLDVPLDLQTAMLRREFEQAQRTFAERDAGNKFDPWGTLGRSSESTDAYVDRMAQRPDGGLQRSRVLLKQLELCSLWLRTWDYVQTKREHSPTGAEPRVDRNEVIGRFEADFHAQFPGESAKSPLGRLVGKAMASYMVANWRTRGTKYIEESEEAVRQLIALGTAAET